MFNICKKYLSLTLLWLILLSVNSIANANTIVRHTISASGGQITAGGNTLNFLIGQPIVSTDYSQLLTFGFFSGLDIVISATPVDVETVIDTTSPCPDKPFDVTFKIAASADQPIDGVQLFLKFDPAILKVDKITNGTAMDFILRQDMGNNYINFVAAAWNNAPQTSAFNLMTVTFTPLQKTAGTVLQVDANNSNLQSQGIYLPLNANETTLAVGDCLKCRVTLQGRPAKPHQTWITQLAIHTKQIDQITTDNRGLCYLPTSVSPGNNSFCAKGKTTLANKIGPPIDGTQFRIDLGTLYEGDANNDNKINFDDVALFRKTLNKCAGNADYNANADFNQDGCVNNQDKETAFGDGSGKDSNFGRPSACALDPATNTLRKGQRGGRRSVTLTTSEIPAGLKVSDTFEMAIQVNADEAQAVDGTAAYLNFDPESLQVNELIAGEQFDFVLQSDFNNDKGEINFAASSWETDFPQGNFTLVTVKFTLVKPGGGKTITFNTSGDRQTAAVSDGQPVTDTENVGEVVVEELILPEVPGEEAILDGLPDPNESSDGIENPNTEGLPDPDDNNDGIENPITDGLPGFENEEDDEEEEKTYQVSGQLLDKSDNPLIGVTIQIGDKTVVTDDNGAWKISELAAGEYTVKASKDGYTFETSQINLSGEQTVQQVSLVVLIAPKTHKASGIIKNRQGQPIAGVVVKIGEQTQTTDANGYWEFADLLEGDYTVIASKNGYHVSTENVAIGNDQDATVKFILDSVLAVKVVAPRIAKQGENVTYAIIVTNQGEGTATGVNLAVVLPANTQLVNIKALDVGSCDANNLTCDLGNLNSGASANVEVVVSNHQAETLLNTVTVTAQEYPTEVKTTRTNVIPYLSVNITDSPDPIPMLNMLYYTLTVELSEYAPSNATGVTLVSTLPQGVELKSIRTDDGVCDSNASQQITCQLNELSVANAAKVEIEVTLIDGGLLLLTHEATVTANEYAAHQDRERTRIFIPEEIQVDIVMVIDVTGSMQDEINGVIGALQAFIEKIDSSQSPLMALIIFGDEVKVAAFTRDLEILRNAVTNLTANGGGTCHEASIEALSVALRHIKNGGDILFSTDASPYPDADVEGVVQLLKEKAVKFNALITGDCTMKESWNTLP
jgi:uncharacterized repeat protein (TIGR01451 family)